MSFDLDVVSIKGKLFEGKADELVLPTIDGEVTVLARHMPVILPLGIGEVVVKKENSTLNYSIGKGIFSFIENKATLLIEDAASADDISEEAALIAQKKAKEIIEKGVTGEDLQKAMYSLRKSLFDLKVVRKKRKSNIRSG